MKIDTINNGLSAKLILKNSLCITRYKLTIPPKMHKIKPNPPNTWIGLLENLCQKVTTIKSRNPFTTLLQLYFVVPYFLS
jgi:hypothetical protein